MSELKTPIHLSSATGMGLSNCTKSSQEISPTVLITKEIWNDMNSPWTEQGIIIANPGYVWVTKWEIGLNHTIWKAYDDNGNYLALYADIGSEVKKNDAGYFEFDDWYLDVFQPAGRKPMLLDEDELQDAVRLGYLNNEQAKIAYDEAYKLLKELELETPDF
jgi:predicted RNA-binding protein associated with RNAse of E/G family